MPRNTHQRRAVQAVFERDRRPLGPDEVRQGAIALVPGIGLATIYRHIRSLVQEGWLKEVELPGQPSRYELAGLRHHHHFQCNACGRVYDIEGCPGPVHTLAPPGFRVDDHEVVLYGRCAECVG